VHVHFAGLMMHRSLLAQVITLPLKIPPTTASLLHLRWG